METELQRLADAAERIEREAGELRAQVAALAAATREHAAQAPTGAPAQADTGAPGAGGDEAEARLVAYSMVLDGRPRDEVASHLADELGVTDSDALLDDLYADVGR